MVKRLTTTTVGDEEILDQEVYEHFDRDGCILAVIMVIGIVVGTIANAPLSGYIN